MGVTLLRWKAGEAHVAGEAALPMTGIPYAAGHISRPSRSCRVHELSPRKLPGIDRLSSVPLLHLRLHRETVTASREMVEASSPRMTLPFACSTALAALTVSRKKDPRTQQ